MEFFNNPYSGTLLVVFAIGIGLVFFLAASAVEWFLGRKPKNELAFRFDPQRSNGFVGSSIPSGTTCVHGIDLHDRCFDCYVSANEEADRAGRWLY